jgi:hypothetical protein
MKRKCNFCDKPVLTLGQLLILGLGMRIRCRECGTLMSSNEIYQFIASVVLILLTIFLLVWLGNSLGIVGIIFAFVIPLVIEIVSMFWIPLSVIKEGSRKE